MAKYRKRRRRGKFTLAVFLLLSLVTAYMLYYQSTPPSSGELVGFRELPPNFESHGIDISRYQGEIDWEVLFDQTDSIISFIYCKATEGVSHVDEHYKRNKEALREHNKAFGVYHFFTPSLNAESQAEHFLNNYSPNGNELPPVLDVETESVADEKLVARMQEWLNIVERRTGKRPIIYTSYHFYKTKFKSEFKNYQFWIANYSHRNDRMLDERIIHWQYSDKGGVPGIEGPVDLNFSKQNFN